MNYSSAILEVIGDLLAIFINRCENKTNLNKLKLILENKGSWQKAYDLFDEMRSKNKETLSLDKKLQIQFEESCAKTIFNLSGPQAPFDPDSPFWVIPKAIALANLLRIEEINEIIIKAGKAGINETN